MLRTARLLLATIALSLFGQPPLPPAQERQSRMWAAIKKGLTASDGQEFFESRVKGTLIPGGTDYLDFLRGTVVSSSPADRPKFIVLAISDRETPEVTLKLERPLRTPIRPGTGVEFKGGVDQFTASPFMLTLGVAPGWLKILRSPPI